LNHPQQEQLKFIIVPKFVDTLITSGIRESSQEKNRSRHTVAAGGHGAKLGQAGGDFDLWSPELFCPNQSDVRTNPQIIPKSQFYNLKTVK